MKQFFKKYVGVLLGSVYGLTLRIFFNIEDLGDFFSLFSITFIWFIPVVVGLIPLFYASKEQLKSFKYRVFSPVLTVFIFFLLCFLTGIEDLICILIISIPFLLGAMGMGILAAEIIEVIRVKRGILFSILFAPLVLSPIEQQLNTPTGSYSVATSITINADPETVWQNIVRVKQIEVDEYNKGIFNYIGIPGPLFAELDKDELGATRVGHFEGGLKFVEKVTCWDRNMKIAFDISIVDSSIGQTIFDQHILRGNHFRFLNATYNLRSLSTGQTELILTSSYQLKTNFNWYASFWGDKLLVDFQERLLDVIKKRCQQ